jgi:hypothetical protein
MFVLFSKNKHEHHEAEVCKSAFALLLVLALVCAVTVAHGGHTF